MRPSLRYLSYSGVFPNGIGMLKFGIVGFWTGMVPHMELPWILAVVLKPMLMGIEISWWQTLYANSQIFF